MKYITTFKQSRMLADILPKESADMYYMESSDTYRERSKLVPETDNLAWSLGALLDILPYPQLSKDKLGSGKIGWMVSAYPNDCRYDSCWHDNPIDACYELIIKLNEMNLL